MEQGYVRPVDDRAVNKLQLARGVYGGTLRTP
jgi:hypothetical protein